MPIEFTPPPVERQRRHSYDSFLEAVQRSTDWVSIPVDEIGGSDNRRKQGNILQGARVRGFKVQTSVQGGRLYARLISPSEAKNTTNSKPTLTVHQ